MSAAPPQEQATQQPQESRFEDFMSDSIGAALKENPRMPAIDEMDGKEPPPEPEQPAEVAAEPAAQETPLEQSPLIPDFGKLAFGEKISVPAPATPQEVEKKTVSEIPTPDQLPDKLPGKATPQVEQAFESMRKANKALFSQNATLTTQLKELQARVKDFEGKTPMDKDEFTRITNER